MCDTMVVLGSASADGVTLFGKNSDRDPREAHEIVRIPATRHPLDAAVRCTYIDVPQVAQTFEVLLCKPFWIWGAEMGANEHGVAIGNEAVFTKVPYDRSPGLIGMDFLRLALERSRTARTRRPSSSRARVGCPESSADTFMTTSSSSAPAAIACAAPATLVADRSAPCGKLTTAHTLTSDPRNLSTMSGTKAGNEQSAARCISRAARQASSTSAVVVPGLSTVWSRVLASSSTRIRTAREEGHRRTTSSGV